jgi:hypothetical protein
MRNGVAEKAIEEKKEASMKSNESNGAQYQ